MEAVKAMWRGGPALRPDNVIEAGATEAGQAMCGEAVEARSPVNAMVWCMRSGRGGLCDGGCGGTARLPDLNRQLPIAVGLAAGPQPLAPNRSGCCRTSTASARSQWALYWTILDLSSIRQIAVRTTRPSSLAHGQGVRLRGQRG